MLDKELNTIATERKAQAMEWELEQHRKLEGKIADVLLFLRATMGSDYDGTGSPIHLDESARCGLDFILNQTASLAYHGINGRFFDVDGVTPYGRELNNPHTKAA